MNIYISNCKVKTYVKKQWIFFSFLNSCKIIHQNRFRLSHYLLKIVNWDQKFLLHESNTFVLKQQACYSQLLYLWGKYFTFFIICVEILFEWLWGIIKILNINSANLLKSVMYITGYQCTTYIVMYMNVDFIDFGTGIWKKLFRFAAHRLNLLNVF